MGGPGAAADAYDACVIGAGPVGQSVARELARRGLRTVVVEAGGPLPTVASNNACPTTVAGDDRYGTLPWKTWRAWGGTSWAWGVDVLGGSHGVRLAAVEPAVVERRGLHPAWPLTAAELAGLQDRALAAMGVSARAADMVAVPDEEVFGLGRAQYVFAQGTRFHGPLDTDLHVLTRSLVVRLLPAAHDGSVTGVQLLDASGRRRSVAARVVVLAAGAVENARLALLLREELPSMRDKPALGAGLMDRPRISGRLRTQGPPGSSWARFGLRQSGPTVVMDRWTTDPVAVRAGAPSASFVLAPDASPPWRRRLAAVSRSWLVEAPQLLAMHAGDRGRGRTGRLLAYGAQRTYRLRSRVHRLLLGTAYDLDWADWTGGQWSRCRTWSVTASVEQWPHPDNRVELTGDGGSRLVWGRPVRREDTQAALDAATAALAAAGAGQLAWPEEGFDATSSHHLMGGLAFGDDPRRSATDRNGRLRGTTNVYAAGACLFPTSGHANPTLAAVALGLHVADAVVAALGRAETSTTGSAAGQSRAESSVPTQEPAPQRRAPRSRAPA